MKTVTYYNVLNEQIWMLLISTFAFYYPENITHILKLSKARKELKLDCCGVKPISLKSQTNVPLIVPELPQNLFNKLIIPKGERSYLIFTIV